MKVTVLTPLAHQPISASSPVMFLAGSMKDQIGGWRSKVIEHFSNIDSTNPLVIVDPTRDDWDEHWVETINDVRFAHQTTYTIENLEKADTVLMWLETGSVSAISLFELGLLAGWTAAGLLNKTVIGCPRGFWRRGDIEIVANRYRMTLVETFDEMLEEGQYVLERNYNRRVSNEYTYTPIK